MKPRVRHDSRGYYRFWFTFFSSTGEPREVWVGPYDTLDAAVAAEFYPR